MALYSQTDRLLKWRYKVSALQIIFPNEEPKTLVNEKLKTIKEYIACGSILKS